MSLTRIFIFVLFFGQSATAFATISEGFVRGNGSGGLVGPSKADCDAHPNIPGCLINREGLADDGSWDEGQNGEDGGLQGLYVAQGMEIYVSPREGFIRGNGEDGKGCEQFSNDAVCDTQGHDNGEGGSWGNHNGSEEPGNGYYYQEEL
ncbi:hypothetical protein [Bdellovibrio sp. HCB-110]|uniref:hypothetical protein n=1 Tax=Bdellovibrio sp. HCB-110 TaxID=3391182 RepID=UPI0039B373CD